MSKEFEKEVLCALNDLSAHDTSSRLGDYFIALNASIISANGAFASCKAVADAACEQLRQTEGKLLSAQQLLKTREPKGQQWRPPDVPIDFGKSWEPLNVPIDLKHLGKLGEECGELSAVVSRCIIQGLDGVNPETKKVNRDWLKDEMADVLANICLCGKHFDLNQDYITTRAGDKQAKLAAWHAMLAPDKYVPGDIVTVHDRYRFAIPLRAKILKYNSSGDSVQIELLQSNNHQYPVGHKEYFLLAQIQPAAKT